MGDNLLNLTENLKSVFFQVQDYEDRKEAVPEDLIEIINQLVDRQADKVDAVVSFYRRCDSEIDWLKGEIEKIKIQVKRYERIQERLEYISGAALLAEGTKSIEGKINKIASRKTEFVEILDQSMIPNEYLRIKTTIEPDKERIKADLKKGLDVPGCVLKVKESVNFR